MKEVRSVPRSRVTEIHIHDLVPNSNSEALLTRSSNVSDNWLRESLLKAQTKRACGWMMGAVC